MRAYGAPVRGAGSRDALRWGRVESRNMEGIMPPEVRVRVRLRLRLPCRPPGEKKWGFGACGVARLPLAGRLRASGVSLAVQG